MPRGGTLQVGGGGRWGLTIPSPSVAGRSTDCPLRPRTSSQVARALFFSSLFVSLLHTKQSHHTHAQAPVSGFSSALPVDAALSRLLVCLCGSDNPPRLCRDAVFYYKPTFSHPIVPVGSQHPRSCWLWGADAKELPLMLRRWHDWHRMSRMQ